MEAPVHPRRRRAHCAASRCRSRSSRSSWSPWPTSWPRWAFPRWSIGTLRGLRATGNAISSAGIVLAVTFATLTVMPLPHLARIGVIVAVGVLLDTLFVRPFLVPAFAVDTGLWQWWPTRLPAGPGGAGLGEQRSRPEPASV
ncbi:MMPL family transporter [Streptomyces sp. NPDC001091]